MHKTRIVIVASCWAVVLGFGSARGQGPVAKATVASQPKAAPRTVAARGPNSGYFGRVATSSAPTSRARTASSTRSGAAPVAPISIREDSLHPYSERAIQDSIGGSSVPRGSSWRNEPAPIPSVQRAQPGSQSHSYFPGMRPGRAVQSPVTYTSRPFMMGGRCTPSRSMSLAAGGRSHR